MAKLPTEQDIGDLPDRLPRRMGVGGWQPGDLARGAQELARGGEQFGMDLGRMAGQDRMLQNQAQTAAANSDFQVGLVNNNQAITNAKTPEEVESLRQNYPVIAASAAQRIEDPDARAKATLEMAPHIARSNVFADDRVQGLNKDSALADFKNSTTRSINAAMNTQDVPSRNALLGYIGDSGQSLVDRGFMTKEQWANKRAEIIHNYGLAQKDADFLEAERTGDTSKLREIGQKFTFGSGGWGVGAPAVPGAIVPPGTKGAPIGSFQTAVGRTLGEEGSALVTDVNGAPVKWGINKADNPGADVTNMTSSQAAAIYKSKYWDTIDGDALNAKNPALAHVAFDTSVIAGPDKAKQLLAQSGGDPNKFMDLRDSYLQGLVASNPGKYGMVASAWQQRDADLRSDIQAGKVIPGGATAPGGGAAPLAVGDSLARGVGGVTGKMSAATGANPSQVLDLIRGQDVTTTHKGPDGKTITETAKGLTDADLKSGPIVLSSGISNSTGDADLIRAQLAGLKARNVDMSNVTLLGVGTRADFKAADVNGTLQKIAAQYGVKFQPLDAGMIGPDGVHPVAQGYKAIAQQIGGGAGAPPAGATTSAFIGLPPPGATGANPHLAPPQDQWPADARGVEHNPDGSLSYIMSEGNRVPVPGSRATGVPGAPAPGNTGEFTDAMRPHDRAELGLAYNQKADEIDRRNEAAAKQYNTAAVQDLKSRVESMTSGRHITDDEVQSLKPYLESPDPAVAKAASDFMAIHANLEKYFHNMSPADVAADVAKREAEYDQLRRQFPNSPSIETAGLILNASKAFSAKFSAEAFKNPIERAANSGMLPSGTVPINPSDPNVGAALSRRVSDAHTAAKALDVPIRYFNDAERPALRDVARQGGDAMVNLAKSIVQSGGADAPAMFREIGLDAPAFQKIGEVAVMNGDPQAIRDQAAVIAAKHDKAAAAGLPIFADQMMTNKVADPLEGAVSGFGADYQGRTRAMANDLMTAAAQRDGWDPKIDKTNYNDTFVSRAYHLAMGGTIAPDGTKYGGIADRNDTGAWSRFFGATPNKVVVPNTIKTDDFGKVINSIVPQDLKDLPNPPVSKSGVPISPAQIQSGKFVAVPDKDGIFRGKYVVFSDGVRDDDHLIRQADGQAWKLDMMQPKLDAALRLRNPGSYLGGTKPEAPAPDRYRATPGVTASAGEGLTGAAESE